MTERRRRSVLLYSDDILLRSTHISLHTFVKMHQVIHLLVRNASGEDNRDTSLHIFKEFLQRRRVFHVMKC